MTRYTGPGGFDVMEEDGLVFINHTRCLPNEARVIAGWLKHREAYWEHHAPSWDDYSGDYRDYHLLNGKGVEGGIHIDRRFYSRADADAVADWILEHLPQPKKHWWSR